jgi:hypothetical protein
MEAVKNFKDNSLDFVYVDGNHYLQSVINDLTEWTKKVKINGIIAGHDYEHYRWKHSRFFGVIEGVDAFVAANRIRPWFLFGRSNVNKYRECPRSFMWVKL